MMTRTLVTVMSRGSGAHLEGTSARPCRHMCSCSLHLSLSCAFLPSLCDCSAPEKRLRLRADIDVDGEEYRGQRVRRQEWEAAASARQQPLLSLHGDEDDEDDFLSDDEGRLALEADGERGREADLGGGRLQRRDVGAPYDADAAALDAELEAIAATEAAAVEHLKARALEERRKAVSVSHQVRLWEAVLELRIRLQRALQASQALPRRRSTRAALQRVAPTAVSALDGIATTAASVALELNELRHAICGLQPDMMRAAPKRQRLSLDDVDGGGTLEAVWAILEEGHSRMCAFRDDAFDRWHTKTSLATGVAHTSGGLKALNQAVSAQVASALVDDHRARRRCAPVASAVPPPLCELPPMAQQQDGASAEDPPRDEDLYDDAEFYAQLLRQLLDAGGAGGGDAAASAGASAKQRKVVDRRASKGRKLRFAVMDKLVSFMPVVPASLPPMTEQLFGRLFGVEAIPIDV